MLGRVIVAFDGSPLAHAAFEAGLAIARSAGRELIGLRVIEPSPPAFVPADPGPIFVTGAPPLVMPVLTGEDADSGEARRRAMEELEALGARARSAGVRYSPAVEHGILSTRLVTVAGPDDLLAIGLKGRFASAGAGSSTRWLVRHAPCPVLVTSAPRERVSEIVAVYDGTPAARAALAYAVSLGATTGWTLSVLPLARGQVTADAARAQAMALAPGAGVLAVGGDPSEAAAVAGAAQARPGALLVLGAYADSWIHEAFFGSTTSAVLAGAGAPVLLVQAGGPASAQG